VNSPVLPTSIEIETLRERLIGGGAPDPSSGPVAPPHRADRTLARSLVAGIPAAWALYHDVIRPRLVAILVPLVGETQRAVEICDEVGADLYSRRAEYGHLGLDDLPPDVTLFAYCRMLAYRRLLPAADALNVPSDPVAAARCVARSDPAGAPLRQFESRLAADQRAFSLPDQLARQRRESSDGYRRVKILNLPAVLTLAFLVLITIATVYIVDQPKDDRTRRVAARLENALSERRFDEAVRLLADDPPAGFERLDPVRPETRSQRARELQTSKLEPRPLVIISPHGKIDAVRPQILVRYSAVSGPIRLRILDAGNGKSVVDRAVAPGETRLDVGRDLDRGAIYIVSLEHETASIRTQFEILTPEARSHVESRVSLMSELVGTDDPVVLAFVRAHVYRAEDCFMASLAEWRALAELTKPATYAAEEAAWTLDGLLRMPWLAAVELGAP
jgi:hypothetical protein